MPAIQLRQPERIRDAEVEKAAAIPVPAGKNAPAKFRYAHYPDAWVHDDEVGWVPSLSKIVGMPGCNGVRQDKRTGAISIAPAVSAHQEAGATYIDPKDKRLGEYVDYCARYPATNGQWYYVDFCETATILPTGQVLWDEVGFKREWRKFLVHLRGCGILDPMQHAIYLLKKAVQEDRVSSLTARCEANARLSPRLTRAVEKLAAMERDWKTYSDSLAPPESEAEPVRSTRTKAATLKPAKSADKDDES